MKELMLQSFERFVQEHKAIFEEEDVYGVAIYLLPSMRSLCCVIGTYQRLNTCATEYYSLGYRNNKTQDASGFDTWMKWSGPEESAWVGIHSNAFDAFNDEMLVKIQRKELKESTSSLGNLLVENSESIRALFPVKNIPIICTYDWFNLELKRFNQKLNPDQVYKTYVAELNATLAMQKEITRPR